MSAPALNDIVALTGATGYVGRFVVSELQHRGVQVRALARPESDRRGFAAPIDWIEGDLRSPDALRALVYGASAIVHMAYEHVPGRYRGGEGDDLDAWLAANVTGSLRLLTLAQQAGVSRLVFLSSRAVFSHTEPGRLLDESHPISPDTHYGAYKAAVESFLLSFRCRRDMQTFAVRPTGVYGVTWPMERSKWWDLVVRVMDGAADFPAGGGTEVYGGDVARVIWALLSQQHVKNSVFHLSDLFVTHRDVVRLARRFAQRPGPLPPTTPSPPANPLECRNLHALGIQLGGMSALETTIQNLVLAAQQR
jgi:nucleoside-diphosphate-sugar epimerase